LAIRIALTKTFLPNARFMILDEVAAGMDDNREAALLGLISSCGMEQVILVTHSPLADSFSNNVITL
jgi:ABC-type transport system involved in cytochrome bd biosynthesis fused ATPase/permease subunit